MKLRDLMESNTLAMGKQWLHKKRGELDEVDDIKKTGQSQNLTGIKFTTNKQPTIPGVISHEIITLGKFDVGDKKNIQLEPYHLIFGESSLTIFDAFNTDEVAGLTREDAEKQIKDTESEVNDAFIAGLTNWSGNQLFCFYNTARNITLRTISHESLHLTKDLITLEENKWIRDNVGKGEWWENDKAIFSNTNDENDEYWCEVMERVNTIALHRFLKK